MVLFKPFYGGVEEVRREPHEGDLDFPLRIAVVLGEDIHQRSTARSNCDPRSAVPKAVFSVWMKSTTFSLSIGSRGGERSRIISRRRSRWTRELR